MRFLMSFFLITTLLPSPTWSSDERQALLPSRPSQNQESCARWGIRSFLSCFCCCSGCCGRPRFSMDDDWVIVAPATPQGTPATPQHPHLQENHAEPFASPRAFDRDHQPEILPDEYWFPDKTPHAFNQDQLDLCLAFLQDAQRANRTDIRLRLSHLFLPHRNTLDTPRYVFCPPEHREQEEDHFNEALKKVKEILTYIPHLHTLMFEDCVLTPLFDLLKTTDIQNLKHLAFAGGPDSGFYNTSRPDYCENFMAPEEDVSSDTPEEDASSETSEENIPAKQPIANFSDILISLPSLPNLKTLKIMSYACHSPDNQALFADQDQRFFANRFPSLRTLALPANNLRAEDAAFILKAFPQLKTFNLDGNALDFEEMSPFLLAEGEHFPLTTLSLDYQQTEPVLWEKWQAWKDTKDPEPLDLKSSALMRPLMANHPPLPSDTRLLFSSPEILRVFKNLTALNISDMGEYFGEPDKDALSCILYHLPHLKKLAVARMNLSRFEAYTIAHYTKELTHLDVSGNPIGDKGIAILAAHLPGLQKLVAKRVEMTSTGALAIAHYTKKMLWFDGSSNDIDDSGAQALATLPLLKALVLSGQHLSAEAVQNLMRSVHRLQFLRLKNAPITDQAIDVLTRNCLPRLRALDLPNTRQTTQLRDTHLQRLVGAFPALTHLDLIGAVMSGPTLLYISQKLPHLVTFGFTWSDDHRTIILQALENLPHLTEINLASDIFDVLRCMPMLNTFGYPTHNYHMTSYSGNFLPFWMQGIVFWKDYGQPSASGKRAVAIVHERQNVLLFLKKFSTINAVPFKEILEKMKGLTDETSEQAVFNALSPDAQAALETLLTSSVHAPTYPMNGDNLQ